MTIPDPHLRKVKRYFDAHAQEWHDYYHAEEHAGKRIIADRKTLAIELLTTHVPAGAPILDAGCGAGLAAVDLARRGYRVTGVDVAPGMITLAEQNRAAAGVDPAQCRFQVGLLAETGQTPASFGGILALGFLQYQQDELQALRAFRELLQPGGVLVVSGPQTASLANGFGLQERFHRPPPGSPGHAVRGISPHTYSWPRFKDLLTRADFRPLEYRRHGYGNFWLIGPRIGLRRELWLQNACKRLARIIPLDRFANDIIVAAQKTA